MKRLPPGAFLNVNKKDQQDFWSDVRNTRLWLPRVWEKNVVSKYARDIAAQCSSACISGE
ncbi:hypothetical protein T265_05872 [Opisthorchis viverrini]|uniref:Uncharacterized protein n=1 Tax=Opisthorchis viverrini TaxID=6198 RepID=A0A074ZMH0_OPIVI|nr:hypothetical protein T265_05871 [Opisthorchis viverrini]XP_009169265.1 hypothetical protein T265_05872 [Opisthorchis viverrini]KER26962.1 hypothetical protein T265_05871 [Opisthorchis viverrini]KER26963.1 hypothetical protein T265_05872 [Opisthorchis viverrini]